MWSMGSEWGARIELGCCLIAHGMYGSALELAMIMYLLIYEGTSWKTKLHPLHRAGNGLEPGLGWEKVLKTKSDFATNLCKTEICFLHPTAGTTVCGYRLQVCHFSHWELPFAFPRTFMLEGFCWKSLQIGWNGWNGWNAVFLRCTASQWHSLHIGSRLKRETSLINDLVTIMHFYFSTEKKYVRI